MCGMQATVLVFLTSGGEFSFRKFTGIQRYADAVGWHVQMVEYGPGEKDGKYRISRSPSGKNVAALIDFWRPDGCIVNCGRNPDLLKPADFGTCPTVFVDHHPIKTNGRIGFVFSDAESIAACAARELMYSGYADYAYFPFVCETDWSRGEKKGKSLC